jgi:hypothetical protein
MVILYATVSDRDISRILADGFTEGDEIPASGFTPDYPLIGVFFCEDPGAWEAGTETREWLTVAVTLEVTPDSLARYTCPAEPGYWWIPAHRLRGATIRHYRGLFLA